MNRTINDGYAYNKQVDMLPLFGGAESKKDDFRKLIAEAAGVSEEYVYGSDIYLYNRQEPSVWGVRGEFISSPHLDDLQCAYASLKGFLEGQQEESVNVYACFDNEEVGSGTKQGAGSTFLYDTLDGQTMWHKAFRHSLPYLAAYTFSLPQALHFPLP